MEIGHFLRPLVNQQHDSVDLGMVRGDGVADLLENGVLPLRGGDTIRPRVPLPMGVTRSMTRVSIKFGTGFRACTFDGVNGREIFEADGLDVFLERHVIDFLDGLELRAGAAVRRLRCPVKPGCLRGGNCGRMVSGVTKMSVGLGWKWFCAVRRNPKPFSEISR